MFPSKPIIHIGKNFQALLNLTGLNIRI